MKSFRRHSLTLAAALTAILAASGASASDVYLFDKAHSEVGFQVRHFVTKVRGRFTDYEGTISLNPAKPESSSVEFKIKAASIDTGNPQRDGHLRSADFFDVEKFPEITFKSSKVIPKGKDNYDVVGTLTLHGVSKEITVPVAFLGFVKAAPTDKAGFEVNLKLNRKDYGITWNRAADTGGFMLGDEVDIAVNVEANKKKDAAASGL